MLKVTGNKKEGYVINHVIVKGSKKFVETIEVPTKDAKVLLELNVAKSLSPDIVYGERGDSNLLILDNGEKYDFAVGVRQFADERTDTVFYYAVSLSTQKPVIVCKKGNTPAELVNVHMAASNVLAAPGIVLYRNNNTLQPVFIRHRRVKVFNDLILLKGECNSIDGIFIVDMANNRVLVTPCDHINSIVMVESLRVETSVYYVVNYPEEKQLVYIIGNPCDNLYDTNGIMAKEISTGIASFYDGAVLPKIDVVKIDSSQCVLLGNNEVQTGNVFTYKDRLYYFEEDTFTMKEVTAENVSTMNNTLLATLEVTPAKHACYSVVDNVLYVNDEKAKKTRVIKKDVMVEAETLAKPVQAVYVGCSHTYSKHEIELRQSASPFAATMNITNALCQRGKSGTVQLDWCNLQGNHAVISTDKKTYCIQLNKVDFLTELFTDYPLFLGDLQIGLFNRRFRISLDNVTIEGDILKFGAQGIALLDLERDTASLVKKDYSIVPLTTEDFTRMYYYIVYDEAAWVDQYFKRLPLNYFGDSESTISEETTDEMDVF